MRKLLVFPAFFLTAFLFLAGCRTIQEQDEPAIRAARDWEGFSWSFEDFADIREPLPLTNDTPPGYLAMQHIRHINDNLYSRKPFTYREKEAAAWIVEELLAMGHSWENIYVQEFPVDAESRWWRLTNEAAFRSDFPFRLNPRLSQNVILTIPGQSEQKIIIGAHYDSYPLAGAADNASGTALLLESAQRMLNADNYFTLVYAFFGAEEIGIVGSSFYASNLTDEEAENVFLMINADSLFDGPYMFYFTAAAEDGLPVTNDITRRIDTIAEELDLGIIAHPEVTLWLYTDHLPFIMRGHTVVHMAGLYAVDFPGFTGFFSINDRHFTRAVSHSVSDNYHHIQSRWPGKIETNMRAFSIFLQGLLEGF